MSGSSTPFHINLNIRGLKPSATLAINEQCAELQAQGRKVFRLGFGQSPFPVPEPVVQALRDHAAEKDYLPVKGLKALRQAVADYYRRVQQIDCTAEDVLIGPGSKELMFLLQLVYYGDLVIPTPSWVSYSPQARIIGRQVQWVKTKAANGWRLEPEELENICKLDPDRPRLVILNYPSNPTGATYNEADLQRLAEIARRYQVILLSDEIYGELHFEGKHRSIAAYYPEGTIISSGLSKWAGAGGWRLGLFVFPAQLRRLQDAMAVAASETFTSTSAPIQYAAITAFEGGPLIDEYLADSRVVLKEAGTFMCRSLEAAGIRMHEPEGGFYLFPDFGAHREKLSARGVDTNRELCERLLQDTGVALLPGSDFGRPEEELTARLSYVDFDGAAALAELRANGMTPDFLQKACPRVVEAAARMAEWVK